VSVPTIGAFAAQHLKTFEKYPARIQVKGPTRCDGLTG
jgi:hypothetical protein